MNQNDFVGTVPSEMGRLTLLRELWLWENAFEGKIPTELGLMKDMGKRRDTNRDIGWPDQVLTR
jgi:hypothetical protein